MANEPTTDDDLPEIEIDYTVGYDDSRVPDLDAELRDAVVDAFEQSIGYMIDSREIIFHRADGAAIVHFAFNYPEIPASAAGLTDNPNAWLPPFRAMELVEQELRETLPDGVEHQVKNDDTLSLYEE